MTPEGGAGPLVPVASGSAGDAGPVVLFDGVCNLCNGAVQFVLDHERAPVLRFAALQSESARALLASVGPIAELGDGSGASASSDESSRSTEASGLSTIVLVEDGRAYVQSTAALRITRHLRAPWRFLYALAIVPSFLRDAIYRWVAKHRYRWFGKTETCRVPTPELRARFLE